MKESDEEISRLLAGLNAVEAPDGFEGSVRSKIAEGRKVSPNRTPFWLIAKFAFPLALLLLLGGFLILSRDGGLNTEMVPPVSTGPADVATFDLSDPGGIGPSNTAKDVGIQAAINRNTAAPSPGVQPGSQDHARSPDESAVFPDGLDPRQAKLANGRPPTGSIGSDAILSMIGISSACGTTGCIAREVRPGSIGERAGIRIGDRIDAIDGRPIDASTKFEGQISVSELRLFRAGETLVVRLGRP